jgi:sirohydrochlorin cobaltochelatase
MLISRRASLLGMAGMGALTAAGCSTMAASASDLHAGHSQYGDKLGAMIMAHGGGAAWNADVEAMLAPLSKETPIELAFGMAEAASMQSAVKRLEDRGVHRIAVVRLFISGESWYERTEQILGLAPGAEPQSAEHAGQDAHGGHGGTGQAGGHSMALWRINTHAIFNLSKQGLAEAPEMSEVLVERVRGLSKTPASESVLIIGHGPETDEENQRWLKMIDQRADAVRRLGPYRNVHVETLREDWPDKRAASEARIRAYVEAANKNNGRTLVIPYRVSGFGPYAKVLEGLAYEADQKGLLPSAGVEHWVRRQIRELGAGSFRTTIAAPQHAHGV